MYGGLSNLGYDRSCKVVSIMKSRTLQQVLLLPPCRHKGNKRTVHRILGGNLKVEPIRAKWYTEEETGILDHQPMQGKIDNNSEEENKEYSSTSGVVDTLYMKTRFCQKLKMVIGRANLLIQQFSHLLVGFKSPLINEFTPLEYLLI